MSVQRKKECGRRSRVIQCKHPRQIATAWGRSGARNRTQPNTTTILRGQAKAPGAREESAQGVRSRPEERPVPERQNTNVQPAPCQSPQSRNTGRGRGKSARCHASFRQAGCPDSRGTSRLINHCGTPVDRDAEGRIARWKEGLALTGRRESQIEVELQADASALSRLKGRRGRGLVEYRRDHARERIGKEKLLSQADHKNSQSCRHAAEAVAALA